MLLVASTLSSCFVWKPGDDPRGRELQPQMRELMAGAKMYRAKFGDWPSSLIALVPDFVSALPARCNILYTPAIGRIDVTYSPTWPQSGEVTCTFDPDKPTWSCGGNL